MNPGACQKCCEVFLFKVCIPGLVWNETRQDGTGGHFPTWWDHDNTNVFKSRCSGKSGKKMGNKRDGAGLLSTTRESLEKYRITEDRKRRASSPLCSSHPLNQLIQIGDFVIQYIKSECNWIVSNSYTYEVESNCSINTNRQKKLSCVMKKQWKSQISNRGRYSISIINQQLWCIHIFFFNVLKKLFHL